MNCGYSFLVYLFRFPLLIEELLVLSRLVTGFYDGCNVLFLLIHCSEALRTNLFSPRSLIFSQFMCTGYFRSRFINSFVKVLNRIFAVLVKANPSRELNYRLFGFNVKEK